MIYFRAKQSASRYVLGLVLVLAAGTLVACSGSSRRVSAVSVAQSPAASGSSAAAAVTHATSPAPSATVPALTEPAQSSAPLSYQAGVEYTIVPNNPSDPQASTEITGYNWEPGVGSLGYATEVIEVQSGIAYEKGWDASGAVSVVSLSRCNGVHEQGEVTYNAGGSSMPWVDLGSMPTVCPNLSAWDIVMNLVQNNDWSYNVVK